MKVIQHMNCTTFKVKDFGDPINTCAPAWKTNRACENTLLSSVELCPEEHVGCCVEAFFVQLGHAIIMKIFQLKECLGLGMIVFFHVSSSLITNCV